MTKAEVTTSDYFVQLFSTEVTNTYFRKDKPIVKYLTNALDPDLLFNLYVTMSPDVIIEERSIYTFWDLLGDIGGLFGSLTFLGSLYMWTINLIFGSKMSQYITAELFKFERKR